MAPPPVLRRTTAARLLASRQPLAQAYGRYLRLCDRRYRLGEVSDELRADARFQDLIRRTGIPWATFPLPGQSLASVKNRGAP